MKNFLKSLIKIKKASILVEKILMTAFAVAGGGAVITYTAGVINANKEVKLYQPGVPQVENGELEEGAAIYGCIFHIDRTKMRQAYEANNNYDQIYTFTHTYDENVYAYIFNAGGNMQFRIVAKNQSHMCGNGGDKIIWSDTTRTMEGNIDIEVTDGYKIKSYCGDTYYEFEHTSFTTTYVMPGFEGCITIENLPWKL